MENETIKIVTVTRPGISLSSRENKKFPAVRVLIPWITGTGYGTGKLVREGNEGA